MKKTIFFLIIILNFSCNSKNETKRNIEQEIKDKMAEFYQVGEVQNYKPISYGKFDTISCFKEKDGSIYILKGTQTHKFSAKSNNGNIIEYDDIFDIQILQENVYAIARGYE